MSRARMAGITEDDADIAFGCNCRLPGHVTMARATVSRVPSDPFDRLSQDPHTLMHSRTRALAWLTVSEHLIAILPFLRIPKTLALWVDIQQSRFSNGCGMGYG